MQDSDCSSDSAFEETTEAKRQRKLKLCLSPPLRVNPKHKGIVINVSMTKYKVVRDVARSLEWIIQSNPAHRRSKSDCWDVLWTDHMVEPELLLRMHFFQKVSHYPGIHVLARKNLLGFSFMEMQKKFPLSYDFMPKTWLLPAQYPQFRQQVEQNTEEGAAKCYIVKPEASCQGKGIFLTFKTDEIENGKHYVIQEYVDNPFLLDGLKFDFRVYVLLCGTNPMRLYVYEEGLARLATEPYVKANKNNLKKMCMHLTNYAINKKNPNFVFNKSAQNMSSGHKRSMSSVLQDIGKHGFNVESLKERIYDVLVKTIVLGQPLVSHQYKFAQPDDEYRNMCFHILGIDVMINEMLQPVVIEVNHTPSFATDTPLDYRIKFNLIKDALVLLNLNEATKEKFLEKTNAYQRVRITKAKTLLENQQHRQKVVAAQQQRDEYEGRNAGNFRRIYPTADSGRMEEYAQFLEEAEKIYFSETNIIRAQLDLEKQKQLEKVRVKEKKKNYMRTAEPVSKSELIRKPANKGSQKVFRQFPPRNSSTEIFKKGLGHSVQLFAEPQGKFKPMKPPLIGTTDFIQIARGYEQIIKTEDSNTVQARKRLFSEIVSQLPKQIHTGINEEEGRETKGNSKGHRNYTSMRKGRVEIDRVKISMVSPIMGSKNSRYNVAGGAFLTPKVLNFNPSLRDSGMKPSTETEKDRGRFGIFGIYEGC